MAVIAPVNGPSGMIGSTIKRLVVCRSDGSGSSGPLGAGGRPATSRPPAHHFMLQRTWELKHAGSCTGACKSSSSCSRSSSRSSSSSSRRHARRRLPAAAEAAAAVPADDGQGSTAAAGITQPNIVAAVAAAADSSPATASGDTAAPAKKGSLGKRVVFGTILGLSGAAVILRGGCLYGAVTCLAAYQCSVEFIGMVRAVRVLRILLPENTCARHVSCAALHRVPTDAATPQSPRRQVNAKGIATGMKPPPPLVTGAVSLLCVALNAWVFLTNGRAASAMAVASFLILSLQLLASSKPRFSQLTSSVFGLLYCGEPGRRRGSP